MDDFAQAPLSVAEIRAEKSHDGRLWSPRDALISTLRDLDSGKINPDVLAIVFRDKEPDGSNGYCFVNSSPDSLLSIGLLERAKLVLVNNSE